MKWRNEQVQAPELTKHKLVKGLCFFAHNYCLIADQ